MIGQLLRIERLHDYACRPDFLHLRLVKLLAGGKEHQRDMRGVWISLQALADLVAVHSGHHVIDHGHVRLDSADGLDPLDAVRRSGHLPTGGELEREFDQLTQVGVVVDEDYPECHTCPILAFRAGDWGSQACNFSGYR